MTGYIEEALLLNSGRAQDDLFAPRETRLSFAYLERASKVAFSAAQPNREAFVVG